MGYYTIRIYSEIQDTTTIITEFGKFRNNIIPTGICDLGYIFQAKVNELLGDIKGVKTYADDILVLFKESLSKNIEQLMIIFGRLSAAGLKINVPKCSFVLKDITYLGYVITWDGIKTDPKKVQGIVDLE